MIVSTHNGDTAVLDDEDDLDGLDQDIDYLAAADDDYLGKVASFAEGERVRELEFGSHY